MSVQDFFEPLWIKVLIVIVAVSLPFWGAVYRKFKKEKAEEELGSKITQKDRDSMNVWAKLRFCLQKEDQNG